MNKPHVTRKTNNRGVTPFGPPMWQAKADSEMTLSASPTKAVGQKALFHGTFPRLNIFQYLL